MRKPPEGGVLFPLLLLSIVAFAIVVTTCCRTAEGPVELMEIRGE
jgi:hypothetical protein